MRQVLFCSAVLLAVACPYAARGTTIVLFADDFSNGAPDMPVSINAPDPQADPENNLISLNTSVSGTMPASFAPGARPWHGDNADGGSTGGEVGGIAGWGPAGAGSGTIAPRVDFATSRALKFGKNFTISLDDLDPVVGGGGTSGNWVAVSLFQPTLPGNGGGLEANLASTPLGVLFRDNGRLVVFSKSVQVSDIEFDAVPTSDPNKTWDIDMVVDNISGFGAGNSFDYEILVNGQSVTTGSVTDALTTSNHIGFEARGGDGILGGVTITSVIPEPSTVGVIALAGVVGGVARRRSARRAATRSE
jgi:hypothetical protein